MRIGAGETIGLFGGGQLGQLTAIAARNLGFRVVALDPDPNCPARGVVDDLIVASFDDAKAGAELGRRSDVVTIEIEKIARASLEAAAEHAPLRPSVAIVGLIQNRAEQKRWLAEQGFAIGPYAEVRNADELRAAIDSLGTRLFVKAAIGGYDGRGQFEVSSSAQADEAIAELAAPLMVAEAALELTSEISVLVARNPSGQTAVFAPALNAHRARILDWSVSPAPLDATLLERATELARGIAERLELEGIVAVEMFLTQDGQLLVNELAPRPHNTFHATKVGCMTSQFEQLVRAVCDLPLGSTEMIRPTAIANVLGDLWTADGPPRFERALEDPCVKLFLYGKPEARPGRKMGHLVATGSTSEEAIERVRAAAERLAASVDQPQ